MISPITSRMHPNTHQGRNVSLPCCLVVSRCVELLTATLGAIFVDARTLSVSRLGRLVSLSTFTARRSFLAGLTVDICTGVRPLVLHVMSPSAQASSVCLARALS
jgi:hypothetical protein